VKKFNKKYISLIDGKYYRVKIRVNLVGYVNKSFSVSKLTESVALSEAINFRDETLVIHGLSDRLLYKVSPDLFKNNKTRPCIGVYKTHTKQSNGAIMESWTCRFSKKENHFLGAFQREYKKHFSINKYGYCVAFRLACALRIKHCGRLIILNKSLMPCGVEYFATLKPKKKRPVGRLNM